MPLLEHLKIHPLNRKVSAILSVVKLALHYNMKLIINYFSVAKSPAQDNPGSTGGSERF